MSKMLRQRASKVRLAEALVLQQSTKTDEELAKEYPAWIGLHRLGFSFDTCIMALRENDGDMKRASNWLLTIEEDEISQIEKVWGWERRTRVDLDYWSPLEFEGSRHRTRAPMNGYKAPP